MIQILHNITNTKYLVTSGFWPRVRARALRAPAMPNRALRAPPPIAASLLPPKPQNKKIYYFQKQNVFLHWTKLHPTELRCDLLTYDAPS
jgi:hypothetical protein